MIRTSNHTAASRLPARLYRYQRRTMAALVGLIFILVGGTVGLLYVFAATAPSGPIKNGVGTCLDNKRNAAVRSNPVQMYGCNGGIGQRWSMESDGSVRVQGFCLDAKRAGKTPMTPVQIYTCTGGLNQKWRIDNGSLVNQNANLCLDNKRNSTANGNAVQLYICNGGVGQRWSVPAAAAPAGPASGAIIGLGSKCVDIRNGQYFDGNQIWLWSCNRSAGQQWSYLSDGTIRSQNWCLQPRGAATGARTPAALGKCTAAAHQRWTLGSDGSIRNVSAGLCLDDQWGGTVDSNSLWLWPCSGGSAQRWQLTSTPGPAVSYPPLPAPLTGLPSVNIGPAGGFQPNCVGPAAKVDCDSYALLSTNIARAREGRPPMILPLDYSSKDLVTQNVIIVNLERQDRGLPALRGPDARLNSLALTGARANRDPTGPYNTTWASNWSSNLPTALSTNYELMYDDGLGSANISCTRGNTSGCWGHRKNILSPWNGAMGAASAPVGNTLSMTQLFVKNW